MVSARKPDETQEHYRIRLREEQAATKAKRNGRLFWDSLKQGTYRKGMEKQQKLPTSEEPSTSSEA